MKIFKISAFVLLFGLLFIASNSITFAANPTISSISPTTATIGDLVTVTGTGFDSSSTIGFVGIPCGGVATIKSVSPTSLSFNVPLGSGNGTCGVVVRAPYPYPSTYYIQGTESNSVPLNITDIAPTITSVAPTTAHVGDVVTLNGSNFDWRTIIQTADYYSVNGAIGLFANVKTYTPTSLSFVIPAGVKGLNMLQVMHAYSNLTSNTIQLNILPIPPVINQILPFAIYYQQEGFLPASSAFRAGVTEGYLYADNIDKDSVLTFDDGTQLFFGSGGFGQCRIAKGPGNCFYIPSTMAPGAHTMYIKQKDSGLTSNTVSLTVTDQPVLVALWPSTKKVFYRGETVNLLGLGFAQSSVALVDGQAGTSVAMAPGHGYSDLSFSFILPSNISTGSHTVQIKDTNSSKVSSSLSFSVIDGSPASSTRRDVLSGISTSTLSAATSSSSQTSMETIDTTSVPALKQKLVQLITQLLQLVQQAAARGILSVDQLTSILSSIPIPQ